MKKKRLAIAAISIALMSSIIGCSNFTLSRTLNPHLVASANYPEGVSFEDVNSKMAIKEKNPVSPEFLKAQQNFSAASATKLLTGPKTKNIMYSPISIFMALALTASGAKNQTQDEILSVLNVKDLGVGQLETQTGNLFRLLYTNNEVGKLRLANSLWLDKDVSFNKKYLDTATKNYYASLFTVDFSKKETGDLMSKWISDNTNGLLKGSTPPSSEQIMSIINTIYFKDAWADEFEKNQNTQDPFYCSDGKSATAEYMNKTYKTYGFIKGEGFISSSLAFKNDTFMNFYLPDKGVDVYNLVSTPEKVQSLLDGNNIKNVKKRGQVVFKIPKFNYGSYFQLRDSLQKLGMKSAFEQNADFSGLTGHKAIISEIIHESHIAIDEKGCEAAAYTQIFATGSAAPSPSVDDYAEIILDRPFIYTITSQEGAVLFMGVVNNPATK